MGRLAAQQLQLLLPTQEIEVLSDVISANIYLAFSSESSNNGVRCPHVPFDALPRRESTIFSRCESGCMIDDSSLIIGPWPMVHDIRISDGMKERLDISLHAGMSQSSLSLVHKILLVIIHSLAYVILSYSDSL